MNSSFTVGKFPRKSVSSLLMFSMVLLLIFTPWGTNRASADSDQIYDAYIEMERIQSENGFEAARDYFASLPEPVQMGLAEELTSVTQTVESSKVEFLGAQEVAVSGTDTTVLASCWARTDSILAESSTFHANLFRYYARTTWCGNGSITTSSSQAAWGERYNWAWWFQGNAYVGSMWSGCNGCSFAQLQSMGIFQSSIGGVGVQERSPWVKTTGYGNGWSVSIQGG